MRHRLRHVSARIEARAAGATTPGIRVLAMGFASSTEDAAVDAGRFGWTVHIGAVIGRAYGPFSAGRLRGLIRGGCVLTKRQFLALEPTALESLSDHLEQEMDHAIRKKQPWWRRIVGGA